MSMGSSKQTLCILCLNIISDTDFEVIEEIISWVLQVVLPSVNLETKDTHICKTCHVKLIAAFDFKSMCVDTEDVIISYINPQEMLVLELKDVYLKGKRNVQLIDMLENQKICRLCVQLVTFECKSLNEVDVDIMVNYIPEVNINATKESVVCGLCFDSLCTHGGFVKNCLDAQEKYVQCCNKIETVEIKAEQDDLSSGLNSEEITIEKTCLDAQEQYMQSYIVTEEIDIKAEKSDEDSDSIRHFLFERTMRTNEGRHVFGDSENTIDDCVPQCRARDVQIDECKSKIQKSKALSSAPSIKGEYKNQHKSDAPELETYEYNGSEYGTNCQQSFTGYQSVHSDPSEEPMYECVERVFQTQMYKCDTYSYEIKYKSILKGPPVVHKDPSEVQMYNCNACSYTSKYKTYLKMHHLKHKNPSEVQMYKCDACNYVTKYRNSLKKHQITHKDPSEVQMHKCDVCNYATRYKSTLKSHMLKHKDPSEVQMHKCDVCTYETKYKGDLKRHQLKYKHLSKVQM